MKKKMERTAVEAAKNSKVNAKDTAENGTIEPVTIKNTVVYNNGFTESGSLSAASGNGFKLGGARLHHFHVSSR